MAEAASVPAARSADQGASIAGSKDSESAGHEGQGAEGELAAGSEGVAGVQAPRIGEEDKGEQARASEQNYRASEEGWSDFVG